MAVEIIYETHQTSTDNEAGIATGWLPGELSALGRGQARELGERRRQDGLAAVYTSDLRRAVETAEIAFGATGIPVIQDARLRECDYGELNGAPVARVAMERVNRIVTPFPGGQSYADVVQGMAAFLRDLMVGWDGTRILLIAHSANLWALQVLLEGARLEEVVLIGNLAGSLRFLPRKRSLPMQEPNRLAMGCDEDCRHHGRACQLASPGSCARGDS